MRQSSYSFIVASCLIILIFGILPGMVLLNIITHRNLITPALIEMTLGVGLPTDAVNVHYVGNTYEGRSILALNLSFEAPAQSARTFAQHFCDGVLYSGDNPFHLVLNPVAVLLRSLLDQNANRESVSGIQCASRAKGVFNIQTVTLGEVSNFYLQYKYSPYCPNLKCTDWDRHIQFSPDFTVRITGGVLPYSVNQRNAYWVCLSVERLGSGLDQLKFVGSELILLLDKKASPVMTEPASMRWCSTGSWREKDHELGLRLRTVSRQVYQWSRLISLN